MNFLFDIGHPAHVHYFKNLIQALKLNGHKVIITIKDQPITRNLLDLIGFNYIILFKKADSLALKAINQVRYDYLLLKICKKEKIDFALGVSMSITHVSKISNVKSFLFDDDDDSVQPLFVKYAHPYATELISPDVLKGKQKREDVIYYPGYHELSYLHPNRFKPDRKVLAEMGLVEGEPFFILRFNAFKAHHDKAVFGLTYEQRKQLVELLSTRGKIFVTSERQIEPEFEPFRISVSPEKIHSLMFFCSIFIGESQTMSSEAAVLGCPSIRCNSLSGMLSTLGEEERRYELTYSYKPDQFKDLLIKVESLLNTPDLKKIWQEKRKRMLKEKIDVTSFWLWFIENYPQSKSEYLINPEITKSF